MNEENVTLLAYRSGDFQFHFEAASRNVDRLSLNENEIERYPGPRSKQLATLLKKSSGLTFRLNIYTFRFLFCFDPSISISISISIRLFQPHGWWNTEARWLFIRWYCFRISSRPANTMYNRNQAASRVADRRPPTADTPGQCGVYPLYRYQ